MSWTTIKQWGRPWKRNELSIDNLRYRADHIGSYLLLLSLIIIILMPTLWLPGLDHTQKIIVGLSVIGSGFTLLLVTINYMVRISERIVELTGKKQDQTKTFSFLQNTLKLRLRCPKAPFESQTDLQATSPMVNHHETHIKRISLKPNQEGTP